MNQKLNEWVNRIILWGIFLISFQVLIYAGLNVYNYQSVLYEYVPVLLVVSAMSMSISGAFVIEDILKSLIIFYQTARRDLSEINWKYDGIGAVILIIMVAGIYLSNYNFGGTIVMPSELDQYCQSVGYDHYEVSGIDWLKGVNSVYYSGGVSCHYVCRGEPSIDFSESNTNETQEVNLSEGDVLVVHWEGGGIFANFKCIDQNALLSWRSGEN